MPTNYPSALDNFTNPTPTDYEDVLSHSGQHSNINDAVEAVQMVLGTTAGTAVLRNFSAGQYALSNSGTALVTGKTWSGGTIGTATAIGGTYSQVTLGTPALTLGSDAAGDMYYRGTSGTLTRIPAGTAAIGKYLTTDGTTPSWATVSASAGSLTVQSIVQTNLGTAFNAAAGTAEQEVSGLRYSLPIISGGTACTVKALLKLYLSTVAGDNTVRVRLGTAGTFGSATERDNLYVSGAKTLETFTGIVVVQNVDLTVQNYIYVSYQNGSTGSGASISASGARSTLVTEVYKP